MRGMGSCAVRRRLRYVAVVATLVATAVGSTQPAAAGGRPTVLQILRSDSAEDGPGGYDHRWYDYDVFTELMFVFDYERDLLEDPNQPLTLLVPKDYAFFRLAKQYGAPPALEEREVVSWLAENVGIGPIEDMLLMHIELSRVSHRKMLRSDGREVGGAVVDVRSRQRIKLVDLDVDDRDAYVIAPEYGGPASNGYVHGIGRVLRPFDMA